MRSALQQNITTILFLFLLITFMAAGSLTHEPIRADDLLPSDVIAVSPTLDKDRAVTQLISIEGGQIIATAVDGTRFTLVVPPKALLSDLEITMTPVAQVGQLPLSGGLVAAVQLEPEGLLLWEPASLTIEPATPVPVTEQLSFSWHEKGEGFHMYPLQIDPSSITMNVVHFSGYGVGSGTDADGDAVTPPGEQDQMESNTEKQTRKERKFRHLNPDLKKKKLKKRNRKLCADFSQNVLQFFDILKRQFKPALDSKDEGKLRCLLNHALTWERFAGIEQAFAQCAPPELSAAYQTLADFRLKALEILADKAFERCEKDHEVEEAIRLLRLEKEARRYSEGFSDGITEVQFLQLARGIAEKAKKCARFELQFESVISYADESEVTESHVRATVPIQFEPGKTPLAESPLEYLSFSISNPKCRTDPDCCPSRAGGTHGSTFKVIDMEFDLNLRDDCTGANEPAAELVSMTIFNGTPVETIIFCEGTVPDATLWAGEFNFLHLNEVDQVKIGFVIRDWSKGQNQLLARKTYARSSPFGLNQGTVTETTTLDLFHRPE